MRLSILVLFLLASSCKSVSKPSEQSNLKASLNTVTTPSATQLLEMIEAVHPKRHHPRMLAPGGSLARVMQNINNPKLNKFVNILIAKSDQLIAKDDSGAYVQALVSPNEGSRLSQGRELMTRIHSLLIANLSSSDPNMSSAYRQRIKEEVLHVSDLGRFPDWGNPGETVQQARSLDVAEFSHAVSLAYDWLHQDFEVQERQAIETALFRNVILQGERYLFGDPGVNKPAWWSIPVKPSNWNFVSNGGIIVAALNIIDSHPEKERIARLLSASIESMGRGLVWFDETGASPEGPGYWYYALEYLALAIDSLESAMGSHFGFLDHQGMRNTGEYLLYITSNTAFPLGHGDSGELLLALAQSSNGWGENLAIGLPSGIPAPRP